jgi:hypothetical protein
MPIAQLYISPEVQTRFTEKGAALLGKIETTLAEGLFAARDKIQITPSVTLLPQRGCDCLLLVHHRASARRSFDVRGAAAGGLAAMLSAELGATTRVRLIALAEDAIAASDVMEVTQ